MMSTNRFSGDLQISMGTGPDPMQKEASRVIDQVQSYGFKIPGDITISALISGVGGAFVPEELGAPDAIADVSPSTKAYFGKEIRPALHVAAEKSDAKALNIAYSVGRLAAVAAMKNKFTMGKQAAAFKLADRSMELDGTTHPYSLETGVIIDYGMGIAGLHRHMANLKNDHYQVIGVHKELGEQAMLTGIAKRRGLTAENIQILAGGIPLSIDGQLQNKGPQSADMLIASRVHAAGNDLLPAIEHASMLLRSGGLLVARGPQNYAKGLDYNRIAQIIAADPRLAFVKNEPYLGDGPANSQEVCRSIIATAL